MASVRIYLLMCLVSALFMLAACNPDSGYAPLPGPGLSYGGIPYGSVSGNVAEFFKYRTPSSGWMENQLANQPSNTIDFTPVEQ